jgi:hypothetical protein
MTAFQFLALWKYNNNHNYSATWMWVSKWSMSQHRLDNILEETLFKKFIDSELNLKGKGLPLEANTKLGMDQLVTCRGKGNKHQCTFYGSDSDLM